MTKALDQNQFELDKQFLSYALDLAEKGKYSCKPNPQVGCVLVKDACIISQGWHQIAGEAHAEINALSDAKLKQISTENSTAYVSLEPCSFTGKTPPCVDALIKAKVGRVVCAGLDPNPNVSGNGFKILNEHGIEAFVLEDDEINSRAEWINRGFFKRMREKMPWVILKTASTLDGKIADSVGQSQWITSKQARQDVHSLRAASGAMITGSGTQVADNPSLNARVDDPFSIIKQPYRILLDSQLRLTKEANIIGKDDKLIVITEQDLVPEWFEDLGVSFITMKPIELTTLLQKLAEREINQVIIEAGSTLSGAFLEGDLVDEIVHYIAPSVIGSEGKDMFDFSQALALDDRKQFTISNIENMGDDIKVTYLKK